MDVLWCLGFGSFGSCLYFFDEIIVACSLRDFTYGYKGIVK